MIVLFILVSVLIASSTVIPRLRRKDEVLSDIVGYEYSDTFPYYDNSLVEEEIIRPKWPTPFAKEEEPPERRLPQPFRTANFVLESINPYVVPYKEHLLKGVFPISSFPQEHFEMNKKHIDECLVPSSLFFYHKILKGGPRKAIIRAKEIDYEEIVRSRNLFGSNAIMTRILMQIHFEAFTRSDYHIQLVNEGQKRKLDDDVVPGFQPWSRMVDKIRQSNFYKTVMEKNLLVTPLLQSVFDRYYMKKKPCLKHTSFEDDLKAYVISAEKAFTGHCEKVARQKQRDEQERRQRQEQEERLKEIDRLKAAERQNHLMESIRQQQQHESQSPEFSTTTQRPPMLQHQEVPQQSPQKPGKHVHFDDGPEVFHYQKHRDLTEREMAEDLHMKKVVVFTTIVAIVILVFIYLRYYR